MDAGPAGGSAPNVTATFFVVAGIYFAIILGISIWSYFRTADEVDFIAAGRSIGPVGGGDQLTATTNRRGGLVDTGGRHSLAIVYWWYAWLELCEGRIFSFC